ncbi:Aste57867_23750 [Aphanomyces stellatus]|uniref:Aste57867_23750 protein n=1 Tax=Aphanomyces stellatus TaxID=120398 RepID=A0A485LNH1_9STRA|nr:hypothetical protein As57867_023678 [Aphanomyces stellatus]VFU00395.1 Aste57867_23750 [Aphanomyces stellatus]
MQLMRWVSLAAAIHAASSSLMQELSYKDHQGKPNDKSIEKSNLKVRLFPDTQHTPLDPALDHLRPPLPRIPAEYDMFVGLSAFRDGHRCGYTVFTGFKRAASPDRLFFGVVDQVSPGDETCLDAYCKLAAAEWPHEACKYQAQIQIDQRPANDSRGPTLARHHQQAMVGDQTFCLQLDAHSVFTNNWDVGLVADWTATGNEMAILSTYLHNLHEFILPDGTNNPPKNVPHICQTMRGGNGLVRNIGADIIVDSKAPQLAALWGAGLSFGKCHAEKRVRVDPHTPWMFDGEEFLRMAALWTHGYDVYSPSSAGSVVYHNYSKVANRFENVHVDEALKATEKERGVNRFKLRVGWAFQGEVDTRDLDIYGLGTARTLHEYLRFSGVTFDDDKADQHSCKQLFWFPYSDPAPVEALVPGWTMETAKVTAVAVVPKFNLQGSNPRVLPKEDKLVQGEDVEEGGMDGVPLWRHPEINLLGLVCLVAVGVAVYGAKSRRTHRD